MFHGIGDLRGDHFLGRGERCVLKQAVCGEQSVETGAVVLLHGHDVISVRRLSAGEHMTQLKRDQKKAGQLNEMPRYG